MRKHNSVKTTCWRIINKTCVSDENVSEMRQIHRYYMYTSQRRYDTLALHVHKSEEVWYISTTCTQVRGGMIHEHYMSTLSHKQERGAIIHGHYMSTLSHKQERGAIIHGHYMSTLSHKQERGAIIHGHYM
jgi:hypothetical protein